MRKMMKFLCVVGLVFTGVAVVTSVLDGSTGAADPDDEEAKEEFDQWGALAIKEDVAKERAKGTFLLRKNGKLYSLGSRVEKDSGGIHTFGLSLKDEGVTELYYNLPGRAVSFGTPPIPTFYKKKPDNELIVYYDRVIPELSLYKVNSTMGTIGVVIDDDHDKVKLVNAENNFHTTFKKSDLEEMTIYNAGSNVPISIADTRDGADYQVVWKCKGKEPEQAIFTADCSIYYHSEEPAYKPIACSRTEELPDGGGIAYYDLSSVEEGEYVTSSGGILLIR